VSPGVQRLKFLRPVRLRDPAELHRTSTTLELLFDLCFVVAVAAIAAELHHALVDDHAISGAVTYVAIFVPLWWAWVSYTWHATAFDNDDTAWRLLSLAQMAGVLGFAAAIPAAADGHYWPITVAYAWMRVALIVSWLRASRASVETAAFARRYATGIAVALVLWVAGAALPSPLRWFVWGAAMAVELATPPSAVSRVTGRVFHPGHIAERYGLFTIIVLGECILAVSVAIRNAIEVGALDLTVLTVSGSALLITFALWWLYFDTLGREGLERNRRASFVWGYGHYVIYASVAAIGAGVQAQVELAGRPGDATVSALVVALPVVLALGALAVLQRAANSRSDDARSLVGAAVLCAVVAGVGQVTPTGLVDLLVAAVLVGAVVVEVVKGTR
jgi:low temperature requirement protein LtrA